MTGRRSAAIICRRRDSDLITIWDRHETYPEAVAELHRIRTVKGREFLFEAVEL